VGRLFGTDGVRGVANSDLTAELVLELAVAAARVLADAGAFEGHRPTAVVGRDTRASGEFLEAAVVAGLASAGVDVLRLGVLPTPAVAYLTDALGADLGVMLSASHNPMPDNGVKLFARGGVKLADALEDEIESRLHEPWPRPTGAGVGRVRDVDDALESYLSHVLASLPHRLDGLRVVVDGAHGAAFFAAPEALRRAGAEVITIGCEPDGLNINLDYGATHVGRLREAVVVHGADAGIAHDGDADRCIAVDASGEIVDGDAILAILALEAHRHGNLRGNLVVATVMSNLGLRRLLAANGIDLASTAVGDRHVAERMYADGASIGGEQSGHVLLLDHATTGDGLLTGLHLAAAVAAAGQPLSRLAAQLQRLPQILVNVSTPDPKPAIARAQPVIDAVATQLGDSGRVLVRPSGTEPLVRVMVEAESADLASELAEQVAARLRAEG
jgi:phosphoglucosamine mutase